jgi:hypothetical protein
MLPEPANPIPLMIEANLSSRRNKRKLGVAFPRSFWSIRDTSTGFFDKQMMEDWERKLHEHPHYIDERYVQSFRMDRVTFQALVNRFSPHLEPSQEHKGRELVPPMKKIAIFLSWISCGAVYHDIAEKYDVSQPLVVKIVHEVTAMFLQHLVPNEITILSGHEVLIVMEGFEKLCHMPNCVGAVDGIFTTINRPGKEKKRKDYADYVCVG